MLTSIHTKSTCSAAESYTFRALNEFENGVSERIELTDDYLQIYEHNIVYRIDCRHAQQVLLIQAFSCKDLRKDEEHKVIIICEEQISKGKHSAGACEQSMCVKKLDAFRGYLPHLKHILWNFFPAAGTSSAA